MPPDDTKEVGVVAPEKKIFSLFGDPIPGGEEAKAAEGPEVDMDAVALLEEAVERMKAGEFVGVAITMGRRAPDGRLDRMSDFISNTVIENALFFAGAISMTKRRVMDVMDEFIGPVQDEEE